MAGRQSLELSIGVRVPVREPFASGSLTEGNQFCNLIVAGSIPVTGSTVLFAKELLGCGESPGV